MGLETIYDFEGIIIPRAYGTISRTLFEIQKNYTTGSYDILYHINWYSIEDYKGQDCIRNPFITISGTYTTQNLNQNYYSLIYNELKAKNPEYQDYLQPMYIKDDLMRHDTTI